MKAVKNYLSLTKKEWNGMVWVVIIIALVLAAPYIYKQFRSDKPVDFKDFDKAVALLNANGGAQVNEPVIINPVMFTFNPNGLSAVKWRQLGLSDKQISTIKNYEAKGGHFYKAEDVKKIYAITAGDYARLKPYINIPEDTYTDNKLKLGVVVEINTADSARLTQIRGIGPAFAKRIVEYRNRLGGFLTKDQLKEVYGIDAEKYSGLEHQVSVNPSRITKIKINEVDFEGLRRFPYLTNKQTNAIIQYRKQHGNYQSITDMQNIVILDANILRKIEPYIVFK